MENIIICISSVYFFIKLAEYIDYKTSANAINLSKARMKKLNISHKEIIEKYYF